MAPPSGVEFAYGYFGCAFESNAWRGVSFFRNRVKCVPFRAEIVGDKIDKDLPDKLRTELPGTRPWGISILYPKITLMDAC